MQAQRINAGLDNVGSKASLTCAIHCALMPLVAPMLPLLGIGFLSDEWVEWLLVGSSAAMGITSIILGYRQHRRYLAAGILATGLLLLACGRMLEERGGGWRAVSMVVFGGFAVATAHFINRRHCRLCTCPCHRQESTG